MLGVFIIVNKRAQITIKNCTKFCMLISVFCFFWANWSKYYKLDWLANMWKSSPRASPLCFVCFIDMKTTSLARFYFWFKRTSVPSSDHCNSKPFDVLTESLWNTNRTVDVSETKFRGFCVPQSSFDVYWKVLKNFVITKPHIWSRRLHAETLTCSSPS